MTFFNEGTFTRTLSVQDLPVILIFFFIFRASKKSWIFYGIIILLEQILLSEQTQKCKVASYNFGSVYTIASLKNK